MPSPYPLPFSQCKLAISALFCYNVSFYPHSSMFTLPHTLHAQVFQGGGLPQGMAAAGGISGVSPLPLRMLILNAITVTVNLLGILAATSIVICGILLIFSLGNEDTAGKAKKGVLYSAIGLLIILFAKAIVTFITRLG